MSVNFRVLYVVTRDVGFRVSASSFVEILLTFRQTLQFSSILSCWRWKLHCL